jgi:hypothetical protein
MPMIFNYIQAIWYEHMSQCIERLNEDLAAVQRCSVENDFLLQCKDPGYDNMQRSRSAAFSCGWVVVISHTAWSVFVVSSVRRKVGFVWSRLWQFCRRDTPCDADEARSVSCGSAIVT